VKIAKLATVVLLGLVLLSGMACSEWFKNDTEPTPKPTLEITFELRGTYMGHTYWGIVEYWTFDGDAVTIDNGFSRTIREYFIPGGLETGQVIRLTNPATNEVETRPFQYIEKYDYFVLDDMFEYYRED